MPALPRARSGGPGLAWVSQARRPGSSIGWARNARRSRPRPPGRLGSRNAEDGPGLSPMRRSVNRKSLALLALALLSAGLARGQTNTNPITREVVVDAE